MYFSVNETALVRNQHFLSSVNDGDGLIVQDISGKNREEIRFLGIDAPESKKCRKLLQDERETHLPGQLLLMLGRIS